MSPNLPEFPNLDHLKKQAKVLLRELKQPDPGVKLAQAQHAIAREYGFASWARLKAHVEALPSPVTPALAVDAGASHSSGGSGGGTTSGTIDPPPQDSGGAGGLFSRFTQESRETIFFARYWSRRAHHTIEPEHLLMGLIQADEKLIKRLLPNESSQDEIRKAIEHLIATRPESISATIEGPLSNECRQILEHAANEADRLQHAKITTGHFLLGFLRAEDSPATLALTDVFTKNGMPLEAAREAIARILEEESL